MKKYTFLWLLLLFGLSGMVFSCSDDDEVNGPLTIETGLLKEIGYTAAVCGGEIRGGEGVGARGVCWSTAPQPTVKDQHTTDGSGRGEYRSELTGLTEGTQYYVRAYVEAEGGVHYGEEKTCVTLAHGKPTMLMVGVDEIQEASVVASAQVFTDGGTEIAERGFVYRLQSAGTDEPTLENATKVKVEGTTGLMKLLIEDLTDNETYVCRAYVTYPEGTLYTRSESFTTLAYPAPEISISEATEVTNASFKVTVQVVAGSPLPVLEYGVVWNTKTGPTLEDNHKKISEGDGETVATVEGLDEGVVYYVRPYAVNKNGTYYGEEEQVATLSYKAAISTRMTKYITAHRAYIGGEIINFGVMNVPVSEAGICYGTNEHPTVNDNKALATGIDSDHPEFDSLMIFPLKPETKYYVRAYVTNEYGTNYGDEYTFTTREPVANYFKADIEGNNFNGMVMTSTTPGEGCSEDQLESYTRLENIFTQYGGRKLDAFRLYIIPDKKGNPRYLNSVAYYLNSAGEDYNATWKTSLSMSQDYVYTCAHSTTQNNNATNVAKNAATNGLTDDLMHNVQFVTESPFVIDWDNEQSLTVTKNGIKAIFYLIPLNNPEKYKRMGVLRMSTSTTYTDWW